MNRPKNLRKRLRADFDDHLLDSDLVLAASAKAHSDSVRAVRASHASDIGWSLARMAADLV